MVGVSKRERDADPKGSTGADGMSVYICDFTHLGYEVSKANDGKG